MAKRKSALSVRGKPTGRRGRSTLVEYDSQSLLTFFLREHPEPYGEVKDPEIDYSDIPELTSTQMSKAQRLRPGRPTMGIASRKMISLKIDPILLNRVKKWAEKNKIGYQTLIHNIVSEYMKKTTD